MSTFTRRTATVDIYQGDYLDRIRLLEREYEAAIESEKHDGPRRLSDVPESEAKFEAHQALVAEAEQTKVSIVVQALPRPAWRDLVALHPPRDGHKNDNAAGVNESTFDVALVRVSVVTPELTEEDLDDLSDVDFERIYLTAFAINRSAVGGPKALTRASQESQESDGI